jgi:hypothetical protein
MFFPWWHEVVAVGVLAMVVCGLRLVFADFVLDRFGDVLNDHLRRLDG